MIGKVNPTVILHLGVHKTATTYTQSRLWNSKDELASSGVNYIRLAELRARLTSKLGGSQFTSQDVFNVLYPYLNCKRLIISDENILGGTDAPRKEKLYPKAKWKVEKLLSGLEGFDVVIFLTLRNYPEYLVSRYSESLRHFKFICFNEYMSNLKRENISWLPLLEDLAGTGCKIYVNDFSYVIKGESYLQHLVGKKIKLEEASQGSKIKRSKITQEAYEIAKFYAETYSDTTVRKLINLMDNHPQEKKATPFMPFSEQEMESLSLRYRQDLEVINEDPRFQFID